MPYKIDHKGPPETPVRLLLEETGEVLGTHKSEEDAKQQIAAIEASKHAHGEHKSKGKKHGKGKK